MLLPNLEKRVNILTDLVKTHQDNINSLTEMLYDLKHQLSELSKKKDKKEK